MAHDPHRAAEDRRRLALALGAGPRRDAATATRAVNRQLRRMGRPPLRVSERQVSDATVAAIGLAALGGLALLWWRNRDRAVDAGTSTYLHGTDFLAA